MVERGALPGIVGMAIEARWRESRMSLFAFRFMTCSTVIRPRRCPDEFKVRTDVAGGAIERQVRADEWETGGGFVVEDGTFP